MKIYPEERNKYNHNDTMIIIKNFIDNSEGNNYYQDNLQKQKSNISSKFIIQIQPQSNIKQCRICLQSQLQNETQINPLISPCKCTGSVLYVHKNCLVQWIKKSEKTNKRNRRENTQNYRFVKCQMCKYNIKYNLKTEYIIISCFKLQEKIKSLLIPFVIMIITILGLIAGLAYQIKSLATSKQNPYFDTQNSISIATIFFMLICLLICCYCLIKTFCYSKNQYIQFPETQYQTDQVIQTTVTNNIIFTQPQGIQD